MLGCAPGGDCQKNKVHGSFQCYWFIFLSKSYSICYILLHFLKYNRVMESLEDFALKFGN